MTLLSCKILPDPILERGMSNILEQHFITFPIEDWKYLGPDFNRAKFNARLKKLADEHKNFDFANIQEVYSPLAEFFYVCFRDAMIVKQSRSHFLSMAEPLTPFMIGVAGSVASGKSSLSLLLKSMFESFNEELKVDVVSSDSFLMTKEELKTQEISGRKGFPESYNRVELLKFVQDVSAGFPNVSCPIYSHRLGDIVKGEVQIVDRPDVFILEGLNILQTYHTSPSQEAEFVSDYFDVSVFLDADLEALEDWYVERFLAFVNEARGDKTAAHFKYLELSHDERVQTAKRIWNHVNAKNLKENILPSRQRADVIIHKTPDHMTDKVMISKHWL